MTKAIVWSNDYSLGISIIDEQHKNFVAVIDELYESIQNVSGKPNLEKIFDKLVEYHNLHFATEEKYFDEFNYEGATEHKFHHEEFTKKIDEYQKKVREGSYDIGFDLIDYLEDWLVTHLSTMDKKYVECFHEHGLY